jgi:hypothetical protein
MDETADEDKDMVYTIESESKRRRLWTLLVALLCLSGAATGARYLYLDFNQSGGGGQGAPMAKVDRREAKVRRKPSRSFAWSNVQQDEDLYRKDSVQTGVGSAAAVRFNDGTVLELGENSLVVIDDLQNLSLGFFKGAIVLHTTEGDKRLTVGSDGKAKLEELAVRLVKPEPLARYFVAARESKSIRFEWAPRPGQESQLPPGVTLQVSPDRAFRGSRVRSFPLPKPVALAMDAALAEGGYFWRLVAGDKPLTDVGQFRVIPAQPLQPVAPAAGERLVTFGGETTTRFRWHAPDEGSLAAQGAHELIVSRDSQFATMIARQELSASSGIATIVGLPEGEFHWRIQSRYGDIRVVSRGEGFAIAKAQRPTLALALPEDRKALERVPSLPLTWRSDAQGLEYSVEIAGPKDAPLASFKTRASSYLLKSPAPGAYRWRVTAYVQAQGAQQAVAESPWRSFTIFEGARIALRAPARDKELYTWDKPVAFEFEWSEDELIGKQPGYAYQVAVSRDSAFADPKSVLLSPRTRDATMPGSKLALDNGAYYWKVMVVDESGQPVKSSDAWRFAYGLHPPLAAPEPLGPAPQAVFDVVAERIPAFSWSEVKGAEGYEVLLYKVEEGRGPATPKLVSRIETEKPQAEFKDLPAAGYSWTVRAIDRAKRKGEAMPPRPFKVIYGEVLGAPQVTSPEVQ